MSVLYTDMDMRVKQMRVRMDKIRVLNTASIVVVIAAIFMLGVWAGENHWDPFSRKSSVTGLPSTLDYTSVNQLYAVLRENYNGKLTESQILDGLKHGLADAPERFSISEVLYTN